MPSEMTANYPRFDAERLRWFTRAVFERVGVKPGDAAVAAEILVASDLRGIESHGMPRLRAYLEAYPEIDLTLQVSIPLLDVVAEDADLMIRFGTGRYADVEHTCEDDYRKAVAVAASRGQQDIDFVANYTSFQDARRALTSGGQRAGRAVPAQGHSG